MNINIMRQLLKGDYLRMNNIQRYSGAPTIVKENLAQHSYYVTLLADLISEDIEKRYPEKNIDRYKVLRYALYHDYEEIYTGDIITPIKYKSEDFRKQLDSLAETLVKEGVSENFEGNEHLGQRIHKSLKEYESKKSVNLENRIVKFADTIQSLGYVIQEVNLGNTYMESILKRLVKGMINKYGPTIIFRKYIEDLVVAIEEESLLKVNILGDGYKDLLALIPQEGQGLRDVIEDPSAKRV